MAAADAPSANGQPEAAEPSIDTNDSGRQDGSFAQGMYVSIWPKIERCHNYVSVLLAAQEQLQETVDHLIAGLKEAEQAEASSLVGYADRLKHFPSRVERLQHKLELIEDRLITLRASRSRAASAVSKNRASDAAQSPAAAALF